MESRAGLRHLGILLHRQIYAGLPDGELSTETSQLTKHLSEVIEDVQPDRIFTTGPTGYDRHPDHIAIHQVAAKMAGGRVLWALHAEQLGVYQVTGSQAQKLGAIACHSSQRAAKDLTRWGNTTLYTPLIVDRETYDVA